MTNSEIAIQNRAIRLVNGSRLYGTFTPESDYDYIAVYVEPPEVVFTSRKIDTIKMHSRGPGEKAGSLSADGQQYSLRHFMALATQGNPSVLTCLFAPEKYWLDVTPVGRLLMDSAPDYASLAAAPRFKGYLKSQLDRLNGLKKGHIPNRPELVERYGYDTKYALSVARLALQGIEFFNTGTIVSPMSPVQIKTLLSIRHGEFSFGYCLEYIRELERLMLKAIESSDLPAEPNFKNIYYTAQKAHLLHWKINNLI